MRVRKEIYEFYLNFKTEEDPRCIDLNNDIIEQWLQARNLWNDKESRHDNVMNFLQSCKLELKQIIKKIKTSDTEEAAESTLEINLF